MNTHMIQQKNHSSMKDSNNVPNNDQWKNQWCSKQKHSSMKQKPLTYQKKNKGSLGKPMVQQKERFIHEKKNAIIYEAHK